MHTLTLKNMAKNLTLVAAGALMATMIAIPLVGTVNADDDAPTAIAGVNQTVDGGDVVALAGSGTDPEGQSLTYTWIQTGGPSVTLSDPSAPNPTFVAPEGVSNSNVTFELRVSDGVNTSLDTVIVSVQGVAVGEPDPFADIDGPVSFEDLEGQAERAGPGFGTGIVQGDVLAELSGILPVAEAVETGPVNLASLFNDVVELSDETAEPTSDTPASIAELANRSSFNEAFLQVDTWSSHSDRPSSDGLREDLHVEYLAPLPSAGHPSDDWDEEPDDPANDPGGRFSMFAALWGMLRGNAGSEIRPDNESRKKHSNH